MFGVFITGPLALLALVFGTRIGRRLLLVAALIGAVYAYPEVKNRLPSWIGSQVESVPPEPGFHGTRHVTGLARAN